MEIQFMVAYLLAIVSTTHFEKPCSVEKWDDVAVLPARQWHEPNSLWLSRSS